jgi:hypothetical protein
MISKILTEVPGHYLRGSYRRPLGLERLRPEPSGLTSTSRGMARSSVEGFCGTGEIGSPAQFGSTLVQRIRCQTASRRRWSAP